MRALWSNKVVALSGYSPNDLAREIVVFCIAGFPTLGGYGLRALGRNRSRNSREEIHTGGIYVFRCPWIRDRLRAFITPESMPLVVVLSLDQ